MKFYSIGKGRIGGTYCDSFWHLTQDGKTGYDFWRHPTKEETDVMLKDIARHRSQLLSELHGLKKAERILKKLKEENTFYVIPTTY